MRLYPIWLEEKLKPWTDGKMISRCLHQIGIINLQVPRQWFVNNTIFPCFYVYFSHPFQLFRMCQYLLCYLWNQNNSSKMCGRNLTLYIKIEESQIWMLQRSLAGHGRLFYKCDMARRLDREVGNSAEFYLISRHIIVEVCLKISK